MIYNFSLTHRTRDGLRPVMETEFIVFGKIIWLFASYISSKNNAEADFESRRLKSNTEYEISNKNFNDIIWKFGKPDNDLFASRENAKCDIFIS